MATTTPMHGKLGALYALRPNGFSGDGLNDVTWGEASTAADLTEYIVTIDGVGTGGGGVDTFIWTVNGGGGAATVDITGAAQTLADAQTITFANTGAAPPSHTLGDKWEIGNLKDEATTVAGSDAQITDATARILNPNSVVVATPTNAVQETTINYTNGTVSYEAAPGATTITVNNGYIPRAALQKVGYLLDWNLAINLDMADASRMGQQWKEALPGQASGSGGTNGYFIATQTLLNNLQETIASGEKYYFLELYNYDPDQDQTGDHILAWVTFTSFNLSPTISEVVKEALSFQTVGPISWLDNV